MGKFKKFAINENIDINALFGKISDKASDPTLEKNIRNAFEKGNWSNLSKPISSEGSLIDKMNLPSTTKSGKIVFFSPNTNPIVIRLDDGTECKFTYNEFRRIKGTPSIGKSIEVTFQRDPSDNGSKHSNINNVKITD